MLRKITKIVFAFMGAALALAFIAAISLGVWVMTGPKSLTKLLPYIEASLNPSQSPYHVQIDDAVIFWDGWSEPIDFRLRGVGISTEREGAQLLKLNEVSLGLNIPSLMRFTIAPETIILRSPVMRFYRNENDEIYVGIGDAPSQQVPLALLMAGMHNNEDAVADNALIGNISLIEIRDAQVTFGAEKDHSQLTAQDANLRIRRHKNAMEANLDIAFRHDNKESRIAGTVRLANQREMITATIALEAISPHMFAGFAPEIPELAALQLPLTGDVKVSIDDIGNVTLVDYQLKGENGHFQYDEFFAAPLDISSATLKGKIGDDFREFELDNAELAFGDALLTVTGNAKKHPKGWAYDVTAKAQKMPVNDLYKYWPKVIAGTSYKWVTTHIREGVVPKATAHFALSAEQLGEPLPDSAIDVNIQANGVQVEYLPGHPKVQNVNGVVKFAGKGMTITSQSGAMLSGSVLKDAYLHIPDLVAVAPKMHIKLAVEAPANDVATYLAIPELNFSEPLGLDPATIEGQAAGKMQFDFLLPTASREDKNPHLEFLIDADITGGKQPGFMGDKNLTAADGKLTITQKVLNFDGTMAISNAPLAVSLTHSFEPKEYPTEYRANGTLAAAQLGAFGVPDMPFLVGNVGVDAHIRRNTQAHAVSVKADLAQVQANIPEIGLSKKTGTKALLEFVADISADTFSLHSFALDGEEMRAKGSALLGEGMRKLQKLRFEQLEFGDNNLTMAVDAQNDGYVIRAKGASLDLKPFFEDKTTESTPDMPLPEEKERTKLPFPVDLQADIDWVVIGNERELRNVKAAVQCTPDLCEMADIRGVTGQKNAFTYQIKRVNGQRQLDFKAQNAGSFLQAMDFYDNMVGGSIHVHGQFMDNLQGNPFKGQLNVSEHKITNAPVLAKITSLLSLTGISDALRGKGITFEEIDSAIGYSKGVVTLNDGKAYGPALGITVENGYINTNNKQIALSGTVVPSYTLNTVLDNIPLIGEALTGGKGEGVFAATYKVEGTFPDKTEVNVNPLTMLAPGFLRNVFGGGTDQPKEPQEKPKELSDPAAKPVAAPVEEVLQQEVAPVETTPTE